MSEHEIAGIIPGTQMSNANIVIGFEPDGKAVVLKNRYGDQSVDGLFRDDECISEQAGGSIIFARRSVKPEDPEIDMGKASPTVADLMTGKLNVAVAVVPISQLSKALATGGLLPDGHEIVFMEMIPIRDAVRLYILGPGIPEGVEGAEYPNMKVDFDPPQGGARLIPWPS